MENLREGLLINYLGSEWTPDKVEHYAAFRASGNLNGFTGMSEFEISGQGLRVYTQDLTDFYNTYEGTPELKFGTVGSIFFALKFCFFGQTGHVMMSYRFRENAGGTNFNEAQMHQIIEIHQVNILTRFFQAILLHQEPMSLFIPPKGFAE